METKKVSYVNGDYKTYELLEKFFIDIGHDIEDLTQLYKEIKPSWNDDSQSKNSWKNACVQHCICKMRADDRTSAATTLRVQFGAGPLIN